MTTSLFFDNQSSRWALTTAAVAVTTMVVYLANKRHFAPIPGTAGPQPEFLVGNIRNFLSKHKDQWSMWKGARQYGPFVALWFGPKCVIMVSDPEMTAEIAKSRDAYEIDPGMLKVIESILPYSMVSSRGEFWKRHRKALTPVLGNPRLKFLMTKMDNTVNVTIKSIMERISKTDEPIEVKGDLEDIALDTVGYLAFGRAFRDIDHNDFSDVNRINLSTLKTSLDIMEAELGNRFVGFGFHKFVGDSKKVSDAKKECTKVVTTIANEYETNRKKMSENKLGQSEWESFMDHSFIAQVLSSKDGHDFTFDELRGEMVTMIMAGSGTTSGTMAYAIKLLSEYPDVQEKLYEEIIAVIGKDAIPQFEQLQESSMPYLDKVVKEIQRLSLLIPNIFRSSTRQVTISNIVFPKGTSFWVSVAQMHRDPKYWKDPLVFLPERWNEDGIANGGPINHKAYMPFGAGPRICFGMRLATLSLRFFLVYLTRAFFFKELPPHLKDKVGEEKYAQGATIELVNVVALPVPRK